MAFPGKFRSRRRESTPPPVVVTVRDLVDAPRIEHDEPEHEDTSVLEHRALVLDRALRWGAGSLAGVLGIVLLGISGANTADHQGRYADLVSTNATIEQQAATYAEDARMLPDTDSGRRLMARVREQARTVTEAQNQLLRFSGPLDYAGIPRTEPDPRTGLDRTISAEARRDLAQQKRDAGIAEARSTSGAQFAGTAEGFSATSTWSDAVDAANEVDRATLSWSVSVARVYSQDSRIAVVWSLHRTGGKEPLGWVRAVYDPQQQLFVEQHLASARGKDVS